MTSSAPSARARSALASLPAVAMTRAPWSFAIWIAALETPLPAACTSTVCPGRTLRLVDDHLPRRQKDERHRGDLGEWQVAGIRQEVGVGHDEVTRVAAVRVLAEDGVLAAQVVLPREAPLAHAARDARAHHDAIADLHAARAGTERLDLADDVGAEAMRDTRA